MQPLRSIGLPLSTLPTLAYLTLLALHKAGSEDTKTASAFSTTVPGA